MGGSTLGNSLTPKKVIPMAPNRSITNEKTVDKTGRFMAIDDKLIIVNLLNVG
jgi:hypothetical protein